MSIGSCTGSRTNDLTAGAIVPGVLGVVALFTIGGFLMGALISKGIGLSTGLNHANIAKWGVAAKWIAVGSGSSFGIAIIIQVAKCALPKCYRSRQFTIP